MALLTQTELNPLQEVRRAAEQHIEAIRAIGLARAKDMPRNDGPEADRYHKIAEVVGALQTIYDNVSELEFEEEPPRDPDEPEPLDEPEPDDEPEDDDENENDEDVE